MSHAVLHDIDDRVPPIIVIWDDDGRIIPDYYDGSYPVIDIVKNNDASETLLLVFLERTIGRRHN